MDDDGDMSGVGPGGDEVGGESDELVGPSDELVGPSDELVGPSELSSELEAGLKAGDLVEEDLGGVAGLPLEDGEELGVAVRFFLAVVGLGAEAVGGEVGADEVDFGEPAAADFGEPVAAGEGEVELLSPLDFGAPAGDGGSAANTAVTAKAATARDNSLKFIVIFNVNVSFFCVVIK